MSRGGSLWVGLGAAVACSGCSFFFVPVPPADPRERTKEAAEHCREHGSLAPIADTIGALVGAVNIGIASSAGEGEKVSWYGAEIEPSTGVALGVSQLVLFGAGATWGFVQNSRCSALQREVARGPAIPSPDDEVDEDNP